jgi:hypothetical protein
LGISDVSKQTAEVFEENRAQSSCLRIKYEIDKLRTGGRFITGKKIDYIAVIGAVLISYHMSQL